ncbi:MAG: Mpo1-like protein [Sphingomonadales bacterium]
MGPYRDFWPIYLAAHRGVWTQRIHLIASTVGAIGVFSAIGLGEPLLAPAGILLGLSIAFSSHYLIEGNHPTIAKNPLWSAVGDVHMCILLVTGRLPAEMKRLGFDRPVHERFVWMRAKR